MAPRRWLPRLVPFARLALGLGLLLAALPVGAAPAAPNANPVAVDDTQVAFTNQGYQDLFILDNDTDADGDLLRLESVSPASHGSVACCGSSGDFYRAAYKPFAGFSGVDSFTYVVTDGFGHFDTGTVTVNVGESGQISSGRFAIYGAPQDRLTLWVTPKGGTTGSSPTTGVCDTAHSGLAIEDAIIEPGNATWYNAFDNGLTIWINGVQLPPHFPFSVTHHNLASGPLSLSGFNLGLAYYGVPGSYTLRTMLSVTNPAAISRPITVTVASNLGSDADTGVRGSSSGDLFFGTNDRWLVTSDDGLDDTPAFIATTHVFYGPGSVAEKPTSVNNTIFGCSQISGTSTAGVMATYKLDVAAFSTERLLFFNQFFNSNSAAVTAAAEFDHTPVAELSGLSDGQLATVVNWNIGPIDHLSLPLTLR